jgi:nucleoside-diphosphate-sugar epimerase
MIKPKKVLVTGGCGFIGSEVVKQLLDKNYQVRIADDLSKPESKYKARCEFLRVDLTDQTAADKAFAGMDTCINLAAKIGGIGYFHKYPATILSDNNRIYSATFAAAVKYKLFRMVYVSSSMVFESTAKFPSKESDLRIIPPPVSAYGFSKLTGEWYCRAFWDQYNLPYSICRPFNAYGINEYPGEEVGYAHVIPDLVKKILRGDYPLEILGSGGQSRSFTHVSDLAQGIIAVMESPRAVNEDFNLASAREIKIIDLAELLWHLTGRKKPFKTKSVTGFTYDIQKRLPDVTKAKKLLGWEAKVRLEDGLKEIISWLKNKL